MAESGTLDRRTISAALKRVDPVWELQRAERVGTSTLAVYRVTVEEPNRTMTWYLKATADGDNNRVATEARLPALLGDVGLPVPAPRGLIDDDPALPTPVVLLNELPGRTYDREFLPAMGDQRLFDLAHQVGEQLAALHRLDFVDSFGYLGPSGPTYDGKAPDPNPDAIRVVDPHERWRTRLETDIEQILSQLVATRFADLREHIREELERRIEALHGPFEPALARIDSSIENVLVMGDRVVGLLDWEFTLAATPGYDIEHVATSLAGGPYRYAPDYPDRRDSIRDAVLEGYVEADGPTDPAQVRANRECYDILIAARSMVLLREWNRRFDIYDGIGGGAGRIREEYRALVEP